ncbi:histidine phosphatase family protein [Rhodobacteraceae bacterium CCMM004]|nr:histidine phosphatase family protein [Rhodobacteraceae bacterium CCMM004]
MDDHDRPLTDRGHRSADAIGRWLAAEGQVPERALVSTARRAQQTWEGIAPHLPGVAREDRADLYHAAPGALLAAARDSEAASVALVGHNPGIGLLAEALCADPPDDARFERFVTCATLVLDFDGPPDEGAGRVAGFVVPRDLTD